ncbi:MAG: DUF4369 domain-containing protein [Bacteroidota bacterium]
MKKLVLLLAVPAFAFIVPPRDEMKIKGTLKLVKPVEWVYLTYRTTDGTVSDSVHLDGGEFNFEQKIVEPVLATLSVRFESEPGQKRPSVDRMQVFLEPGKIKVNVKDSLKFAVVTGSKSHTEFTALTEMLKPFREKKQ